MDNYSNKTNTTTKMLGVITGASLLVVLFLSLNKLDFYTQRIQNTIHYFPNYNPFSPPESPSYTSASEFVKTTNNLSSTNSSSIQTKSRLVTNQLKISSGQTRKHITYLPQNYDPKIQYPLLVLLHGSPGKETDWIEAGKAVETLDRMIRAKEIKPLVVVFPDGNGGMDRDTQYIDSTDGKEQNMTYIVKDLIIATEQNYSIKPGAKNRAIGGLSSGGYGAMNIGLQHQDIFGAILSFSGYGNIEQNDQSKILIQGSTKTIKTNSPLQFIPTLTNKTSAIWMISGLQDSLNPESKKLYKLLLDNNYDVVLHELSGIHSWNFWSDNLGIGLQWLNNKTN